MGGPKGNKHAKGCTTSGAPRKYDRKAILTRVMHEMAKGTRNLDDICKDKGMPTSDSIYLWIAEDEELFRIFIRAQELWCWAQKDIIMKISDDCSRDVIENTVEVLEDDGEKTLIKTERRSDNTSVNRDKLRVGSRQWAMNKLLSRIFGDKLETKNTTTIEVEYIDKPNSESMEEWQKRVEMNRMKKLPSNPEN